mmetsp:Transcript_19440/g.61129  ORF Transcript_19440/g.61129 Transcript_19440/m.61129 type:complete len:797 (-) Transcript_19440:222-2612(-)
MTLDEEEEAAGEGELEGDGFAEGVVGAGGAVEVGVLLRAVARGGDDDRPAGWGGRLADGPDGVGAEDDAVGGVEVLVHEDEVVALALVDDAGDGLLGGPGDVDGPVEGVEGRHLGEGALEDAVVEGEVVDEEAGEAAGHECGDGLVVAGLLLGLRGGRSRAAVAAGWPGEGDGEVEGGARAAVLAPGGDDVDGVVRHEADELGGDGEAEALGPRVSGRDARGVPGAVARRGRVGRDGARRDGAGVEARAGVADLESDGELVAGRGGLLDEAELDEAGLRVVLGVDEEVEEDLAEAGGVGEDGPVGVAGDADVAHLEGRVGEVEHGDEVAGERVEVDRAERELDRPVLDLLEVEDVVQDVAHVLRAELGGGGVVEGVAEAADGRADPALVVLSRLVARPEAVEGGAELALDEVDVPGDAVVRVPELVEDVADEHGLLAQGLGDAPLVEPRREGGRLDARQDGAVEEAGRADELGDDLGENVAGQLDLGGDDAERGGEPDDGVDVPPHEDQLHEPQPLVVRRPGVDRLERVVVVVAAAPPGRRRRARGRARAAARGGEDAAASAQQRFGRLGERRDEAERRVHKCRDRGDDEEDDLRQGVLGVGVPVGVRGDPAAGDRDDHRRLALEDHLERRRAHVGQRHDHQRRRVGHRDVPREAERTPEHVHARGLDDPQADQEVGHADHAVDLDPEELEQGVLPVRQPAQKTKRLDHHVAREAGPRHQVPQRLARRPLRRAPVRPRHCDGARRERRQVRRRHHLHRARRLRRTRPRLAPGPHPQPPRARDVRRDARGNRPLRRR